MDHSGYIHARKDVRGWLVWAVLLFIMGPNAPAWTPYRFRHAIDDPLGWQKSQVYDVYGEFSVMGSKVHIPSLRNMIGTGVKKLSGEDKLEDAWRYFIHDDEVVALVFTSLGEKEFDLNRDIASALLQSLYKAGFKPKNFMLVGIKDLPPEAQGTRPWHYGWQKKKVDFGCDRDYLALWLNEVTAIINVPSVMDDNILGIRGAMANLTLPLLKRPARLYKYVHPEYDNKGDPFIPEIYNLPQIRGKVRLHIANGLRMLYYGGPVVKPSYMIEHKTLLFSIDPVALDKVMLEILQTARRHMPLPLKVDPKLTAPYLITAQAMGLGYADLNYIYYQHLDYHLGQ